MKEMYKEKLYLQDVLTFYEDKPFPAESYLHSLSEFQLPYLPTEEDYEACQYFFSRIPAQKEILESIPLNCVYEREIVQVWDTKESIGIENLYPGEVYQAFRASVQKGSRT